MAVISSTGLYTPLHAISNQELVEAFNSFVERHNAAHEDDIRAGRLEPLQPSSEEFIEKASGIRSRYVVDRDGILDPDIMAPRLRERSNEELSILAEMGLAAAEDALRNAERSAAQVDGVIVACSNLQRPYPAIAIEIQDALQIDGFAFDMNVACSSATFGIQAAAGMIEAGQAQSILIVNPEICSGHLNFRDRDSHFIFGDVATAILVEHDRAAHCRDMFAIRGTKLKTRFSNNIRNNFGFLNRASPEGLDAADKLFVQEGRKVFKEVVPMVAQLILDHLKTLDMRGGDLKRLWLHQANIHMNEMIARKVFGGEPQRDQAPVILDDYANTSSAGSIIAFHKYKSDLKRGDLGLICSFGAGYSAGSVVVEKLR